MLDVEKSIAKIYMAMEKMSSGLFSVGKGSLSPQPWAS